ncbi:hypothetical protein CsSME_00014165 [Camellia sinensis var. sinensis]
MQLQGENNVPNPNHHIHSLRPAFAFNSTAVSAPSNLHIPVPLPPPPKAGLISVGVKIFQTEGVAALYSGVSATILRQTLYSTTRMGLYEPVESARLLGTQPTWRWYACKPTVGFRLPSGATTKA